MKSAASKSDESQVVIYTAFNPPPQEWLEPGGPSMTQQQFADECDVNNILANYARTGDISLISKGQGFYGDASDYPVDFNTAMQIVLDAQDRFDELPSRVRERFDNDPAKFLTFIDNPENRDEAIKLGLIVLPEGDAQRSHEAGEAAPSQPPKAASGASNEAPTAPNGGG